MVSAENDPRRPGAIRAMDLDWSTPIIAPLVPAVFTWVGPETADRLAAAMGLADPAEARRALLGNRDQAWLSTLSVVRRGETHAQL